MNGSLESIDDRPALRFERHLDHSVERVWRAITEPDELARWFVARVNWKPELGETWQAMGQAGEVTELQAPRVLAWTWGGERFRFELRGDREGTLDDEGLLDGEGCLLVFTHVFDDRRLNAQHATGWERYLDWLETHLAGGFVSLEDGPKLQLERRYEHSIERVWKAITEPEELRHWFPPGAELEIAESEPPRLLAGSWFGDQLRFELRPDGDGCVLRFSHTFAEREKAARDAAGWDRCFARFAALLAGEPMGEADSLHVWPEIHERYAKQFVVDPELGRKTFAEHQAQQ
jgi:uncharacterized protein YndB with AHSA1/START domain